MNLRIFGIEIFSVNKDVSYTTMDSWIPGLSTGDSVPDRKTAAQAVKSYRGWIYDAINLISNRISSAQLELYAMKGDDEVPQDGHVFYDVWNNPNPYFTGRDMRELVQVFLDLTGEGYLLKVMNGVGRIQELYPLVPNQMEVKPENRSLVFKYQTRAGSTTYSSDEIIYLRYPDPANPMRGISPLQAMGLEYDNAREIEKYYWQLFQRGGYFHYALSSDKDINKTQADQIQSAWMDRVRQRAGKFMPPVMGRGLKPVALPGGKALDLGLEARSGELRDKLLSAYGVPKALLGMLEGIQRANLEGTEYVFAKGTLAPRLETWLSALRPVLEQYDSRLRARFENVVPADKTAIREETDLLMRTGLISVEEGRMRHGYTPDFPAGHTVLTPFSMVPQTRAVVSARKSSTWTTEQKDALWQKFAQETEARERRWLPVIAKWIDAYEKAALADLKKARGQYEGWSRTRLKREVFKLPDDGKFEEMIIDLAGPLHRADYQAAGEAAIAQIGMDIVFDMDNPRVIEYLGDKVRRFSKAQVARLADELQDILTVGHLGGQTIDEMSETIANLYDMERGYRAERIARTEVIGGSNRGARDGYTQAGVEKKSWLSARDPAVRESHLAADSRYSRAPIGMADEFLLDGGASCQEPGNTGVAEEDINCRCSIAPESDEEDG